MDAGKTLVHTYKLLLAGLLVVFLVLPTVFAARTRLWPVAADVGTCTAPTGEEYNATGAGAANWLGRGCGNWKIFYISGYKKIEIELEGDGCPECPNCVLYSLKGTVYVSTDGRNWQKIRVINGPERHCRLTDKPYTITFDNNGWRYMKIQRDVNKSEGFYLAVYGISSDGVPATKLKRIWPTNADAVICVDSKGRKYPAMGEGAATWFTYGNCGRWKEYNITGYKYIVVEMEGDGCPRCPGCFLYTITAKIEISGKDVSISKVFYGPRKHCRLTDPKVYVIIRNREDYRKLRITTLSPGFYVLVWGSDEPPQLTGRVYYFDELENTPTEYEDSNTVEILPVPPKPPVTPPVREIIVRKPSSPSVEDIYELKTEIRELKESILLLTEAIKELTQAIKELTAVLSAK